jgi:GT2 family glycosyltransferase
LTTPRVSALIVSYNTRDLVLEAIESIAGTTGVEVIVVDNASGDGSADTVAAHHPGVRLIRSTTNLGFAAGVNLAAATARADQLLVLNSDARLQPGSLEIMGELLDNQPHAGLVAPALRYADGRPQPSAFCFPGLAQVALDLFPIDRLASTHWNGRLQASQPIEIDHPLGACMLIRRSAWQDVGPLDEGYFMYVEEVDWCRRARARGWSIWHHPAAIAVHHGGQSTRQQADVMFAQLWRSRLRYYQRYAGPGYNRALHALVRRGLERADGQHGSARTTALESVRGLVR